MKKLKLNKQTISILDKNEMQSLKGGANKLEVAAFTSIHSCKRSRRGPKARCCRFMGSCL